VEHSNEVIRNICETTLDIAHNMGRLFCNDGDNIIPSKFFILLAVFRSGKCMITQIAEAVGLSSSANTIAVNKLVQDGLLERIKDEEDKRICWIQITQAGKSALDEMVNKRNVMFETMLHDFSQEELSLFISSLELIRNKFSKIDQI
jgi:DNA-binding MarR family transcriptional regulator